MKNFEDSMFLWVVIFAFFVNLFAFGLYAFYKRGQMASRSERDDYTYNSTNVSGTVESIHVGGRTEVVKVAGVKLTRCARHSNVTKWGRETCLWRLDADIVQPEGRKNYFAPHLDGMVDVKQKSGQLTEHGERPWDALTNMCVGWDQLRCANIVFKDEKPVSVHFTHMKYDGEKWIEVASFEANFK